MEEQPSHGELTDMSEVIELRSGRVWELTTASGERVIVDRGFRPNGRSTRTDGGTTRAVSGSGCSGSVP